jgi:hypothetical protein
MFEQQLDRLIAEEGLDDLETLLCPREWDEVPLVSRTDRLGFMLELTALEQSRVLVVAAARYLENINAYATAHGRSDILVMVSVLDWEDLESPCPEPVAPNFWISTDVNRDLQTFRLKRVTTKEARLTEAWVQAAGLSQSHEVLDPAVPHPERELQRVYVSLRGSLHERYVIQTAT